MTKKINYFYYKGKLYFKIRKNSPIRVLSKFINDELSSRFIVGDTYYIIYDTKNKIKCFEGTFEELQKTYPIIFKDKRKIGFDMQLNISKKYDNITKLSEFKEYLF